MKTHLDLFSGIGGFALAAQWNGLETIGFSEIEPYACKVLKERFGAFMANPDGTRQPQPLGSVKELRRWVVNEGEERGRIPNYGDIRNVRGTACDLITGGFPCQPFSLAGERRGAADDRHLWPEMLRVIAEARPAWVLGENVPGIIGMELDRVLSDLESLGYAVWPVVVPACAVDARHRRDRVWIVAHAGSDDLRRVRQGGQDNHDRTEDSSDCQERTQREPGVGSHGSALAKPTCGGTKSKELIRQRDEPGSGGEAVADGNGSGLPFATCTELGSLSEEITASARSEHCRGDAAAWRHWLPEPELGRVAHGIRHRSHRLKGLGNAIVPQVAAQLIRFMIEAERLEVAS